MLSLQDKLATRGVESLTDLELLTLILGDESQASALLEAFNGKLAAIATADLSRLRMVAGIGLKSATLLKAAAQWGARCAESNGAESQTISSSEDVVAIFKPYFATLKYEECWVLFLSASNRVIERYRVSQGGVSATVVDPRLVVKRALELLCSNIIMVHNHPSGAVEPSGEDISLTQKIKSAAALFDITLVDHLVVSPSAYFSFLSKGIL